MTPSEMPPCACTAHDLADRRSHMFVAEETAEFVVFCCRRCTEITRTPVIQVRTLDRAKRRARHERAVAHPQEPAIKRMVAARLAAMRGQRAGSIRHAEDN